MYNLNLLKFSDYDKQMQCYKQPIWTCQCTGFSGLSYEEAMTSEMEVHKRLSSKFPKSLEKMVLELVHHRKYGSLVGFVRSGSVRVQNLVQRQW